MKLTNKCGHTQKKQKLHVWKRLVSDIPRELVSGKQQTYSIVNLK